MPILVAFSTEDKFMDYGRAFKFFSSHMKASVSVQQAKIPNAAHFLQESNPSATAEAIANFVASS